MSINDTVDMMMLELDDEDGRKRILPPKDDQFRQFSIKVAEAAMKRPVNIQLGINPIFHRKHTKRYQPKTLKPPEYRFYQQFHETHNFIHCTPTKHSHDLKRYSPELDKLIKDLVTYIDTCPDQLAYSNDLRKLMLKLK